MEKCATIGCGREIDEDELFCPDCAPTPVQTVQKECIECHSDFIPEHDKQKKRKKVQAGTPKIKAPEKSQDIRMPVNDKQPRLSDIPALIKEKCSQVRDILAEIEELL